MPRNHHYSPVTRFVRRLPALRAGLVVLGSLALVGREAPAQENDPVPPQNPRIRIELDPNNPEKLRKLLEAELGGNARIQVRGNFRMGANAQGFGVFGADGTLEMETEGLEGGTVKTDSEMEDLLKRAGEFAGAGRYDLAAILWQEVVDRSGDVVFTKDEWVRETLSSNHYQRYRGITSEIERTLAELPAEGLDAYRLKADGEAKAILRAAGTAGREAALGEVVRRYFLSSIGDDAAFELACLKLDRFEFLPAARLLSKVVREYPNASVDRAELLVRLAVANSRIGDIEGARETIGQIGEAALPEAVVAAVREDIEVSAAGDGGLLATGLATADGGWLLKGGNPARNGAMAALPDALLSGGRELKIAWEQGFDLTFPEDWATEREFALDPYELAATGPMIGNVRIDDDPFSPGNGEPKEPVKVSSIEEKWVQGEWMPTGEVLLAGGLLYFKNHYHTICCDAATGEIQWLGYLNFFPLDNNSAVSNIYRVNEPDNGTPTKALEVELFADRVHQGMCLAGETLVTVEGPVDFPEESGGVRALNNGQFQNGRFNRWGRIPGASRARANRLAAYNARNGKFRWSRFEGDGQFADGGGVTFAGSPVPYGSLVLVPVNIDGTLWVHALSAGTGETLWQSYLCAEPNVCPPHSPVVIAVEGGDAYVASGTGLVFSVDAISGTLNWATRYPRARRTNGIPGDAIGGRAWPPRNASDLLDGWKEDMIIPYGNVLVFAGSDSGQLLGLDRRSGELLWEAERKPFESGPASEYVLGVRDGNLYVGGSGVVRCYRIQGGRFLWETSAGKSFARGMVTDEGVYVPQTDSVLRLDPAGGSITHTLPVETRDGEPVGNLFSDGRRLLAFGLKRLYALEPLASAPASGSEEGSAKPETTEPSDESHENP